MDLSSATPIDVEGGAASSLAQTRFCQRIPSAGDPVRSRSPQDRRKGPGPPPMIGPGHFSPPLVAPAPGTGKSKTVAFTAPTYFENSGNEWSDNDEDESGDEQLMSGDEVAEGDWEAEGEFEEGEEGFEDEEEESEEEDEEEEDQFESNPSNPQRQERGQVVDPESGGIKPNLVTDSQQRQLEEQLAQEHKQQQRQYQLQQQIQHQVASEQSLTLKTSSESEETNKSPSGWARLRLAAKASADSLRGSSNNLKDDSRSSLGKGLSPVQRVQLDSPSNTKEPNPSQLSTPQISSQPSLGMGIKNSSSLSVDRISAASSALHLNPNDLPETKKLTLTPDIARDTNEVGPDTYQSSNSRAPPLTRQRSISSSSSDSPHSPRSKSSIEPLSHLITTTEPFSASLDGHSQSNHSADSPIGTLEDAKGSKRPSVKKDESDLKKKKTGGILSGFFGRKKDKKTRGDTIDDGKPSPIEPDSFRSSSPLSPSEISARSSNSPQSVETPASISATLSRRHTTDADDMFSTDAALRKQQQEAHEVMQRQYGLSKEIADLNHAAAVNSSHPKTSKYPPINANVPPASFISDSPFSPGSPNGSAGRIYSPPGRIRPGSLIGSPALAGVDVPMLNVLRIFAGENVDCEATFKTVLLSAQTTTQELIMQSVQRFHLSATEEDRACYYLTIKDVVSGEETKVDDQQTPLKLFELMNDSLGYDDLALPSVKRSSVGSISSISSNLSLNPAISRLGMNDFSDDSAVKFYINRSVNHPQLDGQQHDHAIVSPSTTRKQERNGSLAPIHEDGSATPSDPRLAINVSNPSTSAPTKVHPLSSTMNPHDFGGSSNVMVTSGSDSTLIGDQQAVISPILSSPTNSSPSFRFAMRIRIHANDLPEGLVLDPQSSAIIPRSVLVERGQRGSSLSSPNSASPATNALNTNFREKVIIFPRNIHVSEAIEHTLEAFGIADGVVDGGDDVEDKPSKRRSSNKIRYGLSMKTPDSPTEVPVNLISKVLDAYVVPPLFRPADRTSKEARRRSQEYHPFVLGTLQDLQPSDPIFSLRRATSHHPTRRDTSGRSSNSHGLANAVVDEAGTSHTRKSSTSSAPISSHPTHSNPLSPPFSNANSLNNKLLATPESTGLLDDNLVSSSPPQMRVLSSNPNVEEGLDIHLVNHATIRSKLLYGNGDDSPPRYRYCYIEPSGEEFDISHLVEMEATRRYYPRGMGSKISQPFRSSSRSNTIDSHYSHAMRSSRATSPVTEDEYASAPESPGSTIGPPSVASTLDQDALRDDESAIEALRSTDLRIDEGDHQSSSIIQSHHAHFDAQPSALPPSHHDLLMAILGHQENRTPTESLPLQSSLNPSHSLSIETIDERIQRLLFQINQQRSSPHQSSSIQPTAPSNSSSSSPLPAANPRRNSSDAVPSSSSHSVTPTRGVGGSGNPLKLPRTHESQPHQASELKGPKGIEVNDHLRESVHSSRSNSTNEDDGSISPVTPLTATSPTGESSNYTPISSATRGIGIDSRQSMNRDLGGSHFGHSIGPIGNGSGLMNGGSARDLLLPFVFSSSTSSSQDGDPFGLEIMMNLIEHSASILSEDVEGGTTKNGMSNGYGGSSEISRLSRDGWEGEGWLRELLNEDEEPRSMMAAPKFGGHRIDRRSSSGNGNSPAGGVCKSAAAAAAGGGGPGRGILSASTGTSSTFHSTYSTTKDDRHDERVEGLDGDYSGGDGEDDQHQDDHQQHDHQQRLYNSLESIDHKLDSILLHSLRIFSSTSRSNPATNTKPTSHRPTGSTSS